MSQARRLVKIMTMLRARKLGVSREQFLTQLGVTRPTFFRDLQVLRDLNQPIVYSRNLGGYVLDRNPDPAFVRAELPGVMLTPHECYALLTLHNVLRGIDPGFLEEFVEPLRGVLKQIVAKGNFTSAGLNRKVKVAFGSVKSVGPNVFPQIAEALVRDRRLRIILAGMSWYPREREVSPQRIELGRQGWILHVLDHHDAQVRAIPLPDIARAKVLGAAAERRPEFDQTTSEQMALFSSDRR